MRLTITEKPSVASAIGMALGISEGGRHDGYIEGVNEIITWCLGHLVEMAEPAAYGEQYRKWSYETLPIMPEKYRYVTRKDTKKQLETVKDLMNRDDVTEVVAATDAGREGELIFRLVYGQAGCTKQVKRLWISSMEESAIRAGFERLRPGSDYDNLYRSALCRQQADWLVGINGTRLFTVLYGGKVLKVGRVQTPTLAMLVERETAIRNFKKEPFYTVQLTADGVRASSEKYGSKDGAEKAAAECGGKEARVASVVSEDKSTMPPKLYDLTSLQRDANRIFSFTAKQTLEYTQSLYEKRLCTYPRTDSRFLSDDMGDTAMRVLSAISDAFPFLNVDGGANADVGRILDSGKVTDHHAIIPTVEMARMEQGSIPDSEMKVLALIAARMASATADKHRYRIVKAEIECGGHTFTVSGKTVTSEGFRAFETALANNFGIKQGNAGDDEGNALPDMKEGDVLPGANTTVKEGFTTPPKRYTEDSLLLAMERAGADGMADDVERKGLGTPATRADIIEKLVHDGFVKRDKKTMVPTDDGIKLITVLPDTLKSARLTAEWENSLALVSRGELPAGEFMDGICGMVRELVATYHEVGDEGKGMFAPRWEPLGKCPKCGGDILSGKYGAYCKDKCGMSVSHAMGTRLSDAQVKTLLEGKKVLLKGLRGRKGKYDAYMVPEGVEPFSYTGKDGDEKNGYRLKLGLQFPDQGIGKQSG